jgi:hypothetical protein
MLIPDISDMWNTSFNSLLRDQLALPWLEIRGALGFFQFSLARSAEIRDRHEK